VKAIMVMFDSLRRDLLSVYGGPVAAPGFERLAKEAVKFTTCYAGSLPCMPARRELHTGRYNFLHRSWGPLEPFDDSMPQILKQHGVYTHLTTDHYHYLQDGGATYQGRYSSWECHRGQESDAWIADLTPPVSPDAPNQMSPAAVNEKMHAMRRIGGWQNIHNREAIKEEKDYPMRQTFDNGLDFLSRNSRFDNWYLQIETFDPHEPFTSPESYQSGFLDPDDFNSPDWPPYASVTEPETDVSKMRNKYFALTSFCDAQLGRVLDKMDELDLWKDTMLIVNTDHGFMLSEHNCWGKGTSPNYEELVHLPFFIYDPRYGRKGGTRNALVQTIDIAPTILDFFTISIPENMQGRPLKDTIAADKEVRKYALFGYLGAPLGVTDGRYVLLRSVHDPSVTVHEYTLFPSHMNGLFTPEELRTASLVPGFRFMKNIPVLKIDARINARFLHSLSNGDELYDLKKDPQQLTAIRNESVTERLLNGAKALFDVNDAPGELYQYYGLPSEIKNTGVRDNG
jgi:arylsulfatase A-like enzyme